MSNHFEGVESISMMILAIIPPLIMIPLNIFILHIYAKYNKELMDGLPMFKTTVTFIILTILFYINYCIRGINLCYGDFKYDQMIVTASTPLYGGHFLFFIILLFHRLYQIFHDTQYKLSKCTAKFFSFLVIFGLTDAVLFIISYMFIRHETIYRIFYFSGTLAIILTYIWISSLYVIKLFKVIQDTILHFGDGTHIDSIDRAGSIGSMSRSRSTSAATTIKPAEQILSSMTKYTMLTSIAVCTNIIFWSVPFMVSNNYFLHQILYLFFWQLSISINIIGFALGFRFSHSLYNKLCIRMDNICKACFEQMVFCTLRRKKEKVTNIELEIQQNQQKAIENKQRSSTPEIHQQNIDEIVD